VGPREERINLESHAPMLSHSARCCLDRVSWPFAYRTRKSFHWPPTPSPGGALFPPFATQDYVNRAPGELGEFGSFAKPVDKEEWVKVR